MIDKKSKLRFYLSGSIKKGKEDKRNAFWTQEDIEMIEKGLSHVTDSVVFLNPALRSNKDNVGDSLSTFGHDILQVLCSDIMLVDARDRRGIGVGVEMAFAKQNKIPVISILSRNTYYFRDRIEYLGQIVEPFVHPFVDSMSDLLVTEIEGLLDEFKDGIPQFSEHDLDDNYFRTGIDHFVIENLANDDFMYEEVMNDPETYNKVAKYIGVDSLKKALK